MGFPPSYSSGWIIRHSFCNLDGNGMNFGFYLPTSGPTARPEPLAEMARQGDALGFHSMVIADHIVLPQQIESAYPYTLDGVYPGAAVGECLEQLTVLTFLAGITR